ncbi:hypothetical protein C8J57DRAFT_1240831 [Mycena rebaudengoi]|nr:hypothetical protein C8J57DRAFT_1240831 [Mycena rebaudengoi]
MSEKVILRSPGIHSAVEWIGMLSHIDEVNLEEKWREINYTSTAGADCERNEFASFSPPRPQPVPHDPIPERKKSRQLDRKIRRTATEDKKSLDADTTATARPRARKATEKKSAKKRKPKYESAGVVDKISTRRSQRRQVYGLGTHTVTAHRVCEHRADPGHGENTKEKVEDMVRKGSMLHNSAYVQGQIRTTSITVAEVQG